MSIESLFKIVNIWNQARCPSTDEWINKNILYRMEYYPAIKKN
jgi:hypothetical protein